VSNCCLAQDEQFGHLYHGENKLYSFAMFYSH